MAFRYCGLVVRHWHLSLACRWYKERTPGRCRERGRPASSGQGAPGLAGGGNYFSNAILAQSVKIARASRFVLL